MRRNGTFSPRDTRLLLHLAAGNSISDTAIDLEISVATIHRRLDDPVFVSALQECRAQMIDRALGKLADAAAVAASVLTALLDDPSPTIRLRAAVSLLDVLPKLREHCELSERIADLEVRPKRGICIKMWRAKAPVAPL